MTKGYKWLVFSLALHLFTTLVAQENTFIPFHNFDQNSGLSSYNITKILQDSYGFIWVGTQDGLNCFDGRSFVVFNKEAPVKFRLEGNNVIDIVEDKKRNLLWVATTFGGIQCIDTRFQAIRSPESIAQRKALRFEDKWIQSMVLINDVLWVGTHEGIYLYDLNTNSFIPTTFTGNKQFDLNHVSVNKLISYGDSYVIGLSENNGIFILDTHSFTLIDAIQSKALDFYNKTSFVQFWNICRYKDDEFIIATNLGLRKVKVAGRKLILLNFGKQKFFEKQPTFGCLYDSEGTIWFSTSQGLYKLASSSETIIKIHDINNESDSWQKSIYALFSDRNNNIWVGSEEGLSFFKTKNKPFEKYYRSFNSNLKLQHAFSIYPVSDTTVYCGTTEGLYKINTENHFISKIQNGSAYYLINRVSGGNIIVSNNRGIFLLKHDHLISIVKYFPEFEKCRHESFSSFLQYNDSIFLFGSQLYNGLYIWNVRSARIRLLNNSNSTLSLDNNIINGIYKDSEGHVWVLSAYCLFLVDPITGVCRRYLVNHPNTGKPIGLLFDMCESKSGFWIASYGLGIIETDKMFRVKRIISEKTGLSNNGVYRVFLYKDSLLLTTSNNGMTSYSLKGQQIKRYFQSNGLQSDAFEQFCGYQKPNSIYVGGVGGISAVYPGELSIDSTPPQLYVTEIEVKTKDIAKDTSGLFIKEVNIPENVLQTSIFFSGLDFSNPNRVSYAYKIPELHTDWIYIGNRNFVNLIGMNPGTYTLTLKAGNEDNFWSSPIEVKLRFLPHWYQTIWFKISAILALLAILYGIYKYRLSQLRQQHLIRRTISSDLHDDIGGTLNSIKVFTHLAKNTLQTKAYLEKIGDAVNETSIGLRDMIWVLDDNQDTAKELISRIQRFALPIAEAQNIHLICEVDLDLANWTLSKSEKRNLLLISKEAITNSFKYARCSSIELSLTLNDNAKCLIIRDNGRGFSTKELQEGNGLKNIHYRAKQIGFNTEIISSPGNGTVIKIKKGSRKFRLLKKGVFYR